MRILPEADIIPTKEKIETDPDLEDLGRNVRDLEDGLMFVMKTSTAGRLSQFLPKNHM